MKKFIILSLIITLPINIIGLIWANNTKSTYNLLEKFELTLAKGAKLHRIGISEFVNLKYQVQALLGIEKKTDLALILPNKSINALNADLPLSGTSYKKNALLILDNKILKGKVKLRGDHYYHWGFARKSWRFKTAKNSIYNGINKFNIIIPKSVDMSLNHLSYKLAKTMNLLAPDSRLVEYSVNGHYKGPRLLVEQIDESFLRKNSRMPNDIYKGDNIGQNKFLGIDVLLFDNASIWEKSSYNNHYEASSLYPLEQFLDESNSGSSQIIDLKQFATMAAYVDLTGSFHHDRTHNWMLLYDNYIEKMQPIIWDSIGWAKHTINLTHYNIATSELFLKLYLNYDFIREKQKALKGFYTNKRTRFNTTIIQTLNHARRIIKDNHFMFKLDRVYYDEKRALDHIDLFENEILNRFDKIKDFFLGDVDEQDYQFATLNNTLRLSIAGNQPVKSILLHLNKPHTAKKAKLSYLHGKQKISKDVSQSTQQENKTVSISLELLPNTKQSDSYKGTKKIAFHTATYDLELEGINSEDIQGVSLIFDNLDQQSIAVNQVDSIELIPFDARIHNIIPESPQFNTLQWSGEKYFSGFNLISDNIIIEKGTKLIFDEGATLKVLGQVTALGTADEPIVFKAKDSSKPWGAFALKDERANGSVFKHVVFKDGSGDKGKLYEYTAMFSVHNVKNLLVEDTDFYDSKLTDDSVHVIYSDVVFRNCKFVRALSDALDADISTILVDNCEFINSGNDSIDLMTSKAVVINSKFIRSADKAISIGEGSQLLAINNLIENSEIGMQSKDTSLAYIYNTAFVGNKKAVDAYHKNWRYSQGGTINVENCVMKGNIENATVGKKSKVVLNNCQVDTVDNFDRKSIRKGKIVISKDTAIEHGFDDVFFENYAELIRNDVGGFYD